MAERKHAEKAKQQGKARDGGRGSELQSSRGLQTRGGQERAQTGLSRSGSEALSPWTASPYSFMRRFREEMDQLFEDFGFGRNLFGSGVGHGLMPRDTELGQTLWSPQVEVFERGGQLVVRADLPGMTKDDVNVEITDDAVIIRGERQQERDVNEEGYHRSERFYGSFYRSIPLPEGVNAENAKAAFRNGVLEITMQAPRREEQRSRRLEIQESSEEQQRARGKAAGQK
jgi:HSP20 family protein